MKHGLVKQGMKREQEDSHPEGPEPAENNTGKAPGQREGTERKVEGIYSVMGLVRALHYFSECPCRIRYKPCTEVAGLIASPLLRRSVFLFSLPHSPTGIF